MLTLNFAPEPQSLNARLTSLVISCCVSELLLFDSNLEIERKGEAIQRVYSTMTGLAKRGRRLISYLGKIWPGALSHFPASDPQWSLLVAIPSAGRGSTRTLESSLLSLLGYIAFKIQNSK